MLKIRGMLERDGILNTYSEPKPRIKLESADYLLTTTSRRFLKYESKITNVGLVLPLRKNMKLIPFCLAPSS